MNIAHIRVPETRVTAAYDEDTLKLLRDTVDKLGILQPIILVGQDQDFELVDGLHRLEEARRRGDSTVDAVVYEGEAQDTLLLNLVLNRVRGKTKASEMVGVIGALYKDYNIGIEDIEEKTGLSRAYIEKLIRISEASPSVRQALDEELIGVTAAYEVARLPHQIQQDELMAKQAIYRWSAKDLKEMVDDTLRVMGELAEAPPPGQRVVVPPTYHCEGCKKEIPPRYLRPVTLCPQCFGHVWRLSLAVLPESEEVAASEEGAGG